MILGSLIEGEDEDEAESVNRSGHDFQHGDNGAASPISPISPIPSAQFARISRTWTDDSARTDKRKSRPGSMFKDLKDWKNALK
jgi:hypothetical protein